MGGDQASSEAVVGRGGDVRELDVVVEVRGATSHCADEDAAELKRRRLADAALWEEAQPEADYHERRRDPLHTSA